MRQNEPQAVASPWRRYPWHFAFAAGVLVCLCVPGRQTAQLVTLVLLTDGLYAAGILAAATLGGLSAVHWVRLDETLPWRWRILLAAAFGIGGLALSVMVLGTAGLLGRGLWGIILLVTAAIGAVHLARHYRDWKSGNIDDGHDAVPARPRGGQPMSLGNTTDGGQWIWLLLCPFVALILLVGVTPPGVLWAEEGFGYDVLEYHLQTPNEYWQAGQIHYLPHNIYANFPANAEMLYLLSMIVRGQAIDGAMTGKLINAALGLLTIAAAWLLGREHSARAGRTAAVLCGSAGWITYLSGIAYVENAMLFFGMMSLAALLRATRQRHDVRLRWIGVGGALAGLACGCKYTAIVFIAIPFAVLVALACWRSFRERLQAIAIFAVTVALVSSPWWIKNAVMTGNPFFPLAQSVFHAEPDGWGQEQSDHFARSHRPEPVFEAGESGQTPSEVRSMFVQRLKAYWDSVHGDSLGRFGPALFILAIGGLVFAAGDRNAWLLVVVYVLQVVTWMVATHLYARFAVPMLIPVVALAARSAVMHRTVALRRLHGAILTAGVLLNLFFTVQLYTAHLYPDGRKLPVEGATGWFTEGVHPAHQHLAIVNKELPPDAHILMVGDAKAFYFDRAVDYCVVFNRSPFVETVRDAGTDADVIAWLQQQGYTHLLVHWMEIERLRGSRYGFPEEITLELFQGLERAGLERTHSFTVTGQADGPVYGSLYRVPAVPGR